MTSVQEFNCILCKESFDNKEDLQIHFRKHGDPKFNQSVKKARPQSEAHLSVTKKNDAVEMVSCDVCSEMFPTISKAITHKHKMHPDHDAKYFCPWCGKLFTMKHLYNKHLQSNHGDSEQQDDSNFHCDPCDVDFFVPTAMLYHNKFFHRQDTDLPSIGQSKKLKMCPQNTVIQIYYCSFCGDEYDNKVNLHKHIGDDHSDENQSPEDVLRCPLCDAIFYHLDAYELHLTFHTTEDLYSEKNEMFEQMTEFSLETVAPVMEKVENVEPQDMENEMNAVGLEKFLELAAKNYADKGDGNHKIKTKKHKKHKKSKKNAITLDEFLNMNKDVFGEGLDFQGVEEVPTQVVAKKLKQKKPAAVKSLQSPNLEKLKKQGIVVKMKSTNNPTTQKVNLGNKILKKIPTIEGKLSTKIQPSSDEVLSKLISQSNNQIKIVKKSSSQENIDETNEEDKCDNISENNATIKRGSSPENIEVECDVNMPSECTSSDNENKDEKETGNTFENSRSVVAKDYDSAQKNDNCSENDEPDPIHEHSNHKACHNFDKEETNIMKKETSLSEVNASTVQNINKSVADKPTTLIGSKSGNQNQAAINAVQDKTENNLEKTMSSPRDQSTNNSVNALKHLSHLITVKPVSPNTNSAPGSPVKTVGEQNVIESQGDSDYDDEDEKPNSQENIEKSETSNKLDHLKKISSITIKSLAQSPKNSEIVSDDKEVKNHKLLSNVPITNKVAILANDSESKSSKPTNIAQSVKSASEKEVPKPSNMDLLKHLTNVTAKPINKGNVQQINNKTVGNSTISKKNAIQSYDIENKTKEEIEIFNIDDSDDEPDKDRQPLPEANLPSPKAKPGNIPTRPVEPLKNISKCVTVKPINQQASTLKKNISQQPEPIKILNKLQHPMSEFSEDEDDDQNTLTPVNFNHSKQQKLFQQKENIKNTLKSLGKQITVKSEIPSPNPSLKSDRDQDNKDMFDHAGDSDSDSYKGSVKITELTEENAMSDDHIAEKSKNLNVTNSAKSPKEDFSDDFNHFDEDNDEDFDDLEQQIKASKVIRPTSNITAQMLNLQNMNKNITIKSLPERKGSAPKEVPKIRPNVNNEMSMKHFKQNKPECRNAGEPAVNKKIKNAAQVVRPTSHNMASCSQQNTVNKEVTVQTIQTKTVIQEITTTVTKTIKTVNQTVKQELQSTSQNNQVMYQRVQGMKSANQFKNFQGVTVRQATPVAGTKIKGATPNRPAVNAAVRPSNQLVPVRPSNQVIPVRSPNQIVPIRPASQSFPVRPANQIVPVRPAMNKARMSRPRMSGPKKPMQSMSDNQQKPLIMSPHVVNKSKRPIEEPAGHFSCFKKPKESLIPVSDIPSFQSDQSGEAVVYSSSHMSKSNYTSATKTMKGGKIVTSTQTKSEVSASSQHLERLSNMSGLKVVKTSQMKQASQVEERCESNENSASKRNTLEAIEKLQKQGLLVKKPRLESASDQSDEDNSYITEEPDD